MRGLLVLVLIAAYLLPSIVAYIRRDRANLGQVAVVNVALGWTLIGWVVSLIMAFSNKGHLPSGTSVNVSINQGDVTTHQPNYHDDERGQL